MSHKATEKEQTRAFSVDSDTFKALAKPNVRAFWGLGRVIFWTLTHEKKRPQAESVAGKSPSHWVALAALCVVMRDCNVTLIQESWTYMGEIKSLKEVGAEFI
jgi:2-iminoacetate synthase ThiH